jgi:hypothetical protein
MIDSNPDFSADEFRRATANEQAGMAREMAREAAQLAAIEGDTYPEYAELARLWLALAEAIERGRSLSC